MDPLFELELDQSVIRTRGSARSLYLQLKAAILDGRLPLGAKLPPTRRAKTHFGVSRNTAAEAYDKLLNDGFIVARQGSGTYVAEFLPSPVTKRPRRVDEAPDRRLNSFWLQPSVRSAINFWNDAPERSPSAGSGDEIDFRPAMVPSRLFPFDVLRRMMNRNLRWRDDVSPRRKSPQGDQGHPSLREAISKHIAITRAVVCSPDEILVTAGAQQAFDILARILVKPGKTVVAVEDPGYPLMRVPFVAAGARIVPVEVDKEGLLVDRLPSDVNVICITPSHQFPLGATMSRSRRRALVEFARARGAVIIEDDYDGEFRLDGTPLEALRSSEFSDVVFYVGTFSKCMLPSLRLGFVVAPDWALSSLVLCKNSMDWMCPAPVQAAVSEFISDGHLTRHVRKMRQVYRRRRQRLLEGIEEHLGKWLDPQRSSYGMHVTALGRETVNLEEISKRAAAVNVKVHTLRRYHLGPERNAGLIFGYGIVDSPEIDRGLSALNGTFLTSAGEIDPSTT